jgi:predicted DNA-binding transcriptional regulator YafY
MFFGLLIFAWAKVRNDRKKSQELFRYVVSVTTAKPEKPKNKKASPRITKGVSIKKNVRGRIKYTDLEGQQTERDVEIYSINKRYNDFLLTCWCEMRQDFRTFYASKIHEFIDLKTGEVTTDMVEYIELHWYQDSIRASG